MVLCFSHIKKALEPSPFPRVVMERKDMWKAVFVLIELSP